jgi:hypothetical protein
MSIQINIENKKISIKIALEKYILVFNNVNEISINSKVPLLDVLMNLYKNKYEDDEISIRLNTFGNIELSIKKFYSHIDAYNHTSSLLTILKSINKNQITGLYKSVLIQETDNVITNTFPLEIIQEICSWLYF